MRKALWILVIICFLVGIYNWHQVAGGYKRGREEYTSLTEIYTHVSGEDHSRETMENINPDSISFIPADAPTRKEIDFDGLKNINPDVVGWIELPAVEISYPVLQADDNEYYLHRDISREYLYAGSIFLDSYNSPKFQNMNSVIYGHNMKDQSMFGKLRKLCDTEQLAVCPYFWIYTPQKDFLYRIFTIHKADNGGKTYTVRFQDNLEYRKWIKRMADASVIPVDDIPVSEDRVVTLSTCTENESTKQVVQGILIYSVENEEKS